MGWLRLEDTSSTEGSGHFSVNSQTGNMRWVEHKEEQNKMKKSNVQVSKETETEGAAACLSALAVSSPVPSDPPAFTVQNLGGFQQKRKGKNKKSGFK